MKHASPEFFLTFFSKETKKFMMQVFFISDENHVVFY